MDLINAAKRGDKKTVSDCLKTFRGLKMFDYDVNKEESGNGFTALHFAATNGYLGIVEILLENGAIIDKENIHGYTPLYRAAQNGHLDVVKLLVEKGADIYKKAKNGWNSFFASIFSGQLHVMIFFLEKGASIDMVDNFGWYPIHCAVSGDHLNIVKYLLAHGDNIYKKNNDCKTPIDLATDFVLQRPVYHYLKNYQVRLEKQKCILQEHFNSGIWINDSKLTNLLPRQLFNQVNVLAQLLNNQIFLTDSQFINCELPIELFHELLMELWSQYNFD